MNDRAVGVRVARRLQTTEHAVDRAMIETTGLIQSMIEGRVAAGLAAEVGQSALATLIGALAQMAEARGSVVAGHAALAATAEAHGIGWRLEGPVETKTPTAFVPVAVAA